ncbi:MAG: hypothetical protein PHX04_01035, partial [Bacilli bacterium]|nr:hypothetical protein [Bacilli bacterium]
MENNKNKKRIFRFSVFLAIIIPVILSLSYAYFQADIIGTDNGVTGKSTSTFDIDLITENDGYINASGVKLISAEKIAEESEKTNFKVVSGDNKHFINYTLSITNLTISSNLQVSDFKWQLLKQNQTVTSGTFSGISANNMTLATNLEIGANRTDNYELRLWIEETSSNQNNLIGGSFGGKITLTAEMVQNPYEPTLYDKILAQGEGVAAIEAKETPDFSVVNGTSGLYATKDEYGTSYYYRGKKSELNNNIIWGGFQWKIVRINGDGSVRLIYNGTEAQFNSANKMNDTGANTQIETAAWNTKYNDAKYVGYMYGGQNGAASTVRHGTTSAAATYNETNSNIKTELYNWYESNIAGKSFEKDVVDNLFCNDRQLQSEVGGDETGSGYGTSKTHYAAYYRLSTKKSPTLKCGLKNDRFTKNDTTIGNGALTYPIGLISADETSMAGLVYSTSNNTNYLYTNQ